MCLQGYEGSVDVTECDSGGTCSRHGGLAIRPISWDSGTRGGSCRAVNSLRFRHKCLCSGCSCSYLVKRVHVKGLGTRHSSSRAGQLLTYSIEDYASYDGGRDVSRRRMKNVVCVGGFFNCKPTRVPACPKSALAHINKQTNLDPRISEQIDGAMLNLVQRDVKEIIFAMLTCFLRRVSHRGDGEGSYSVEGCAVLRKRFLGPSQGNSASWIQRGRRRRVE